MQKRISRARAEGERVERQRHADESAENQRQLSDLRRQLHGITVGQKLSQEEARHEAEMSELEKSLEKAHTDGNHAEISKLQRQIGEKTSAWEAKKRELLATPVEATQQRKPQNQGPSAEGRAWIVANSSWYDRPGFEAETAAAIAIDQRLLASGSNPETPEHYKKIRKELRKKFREIEVSSPGDDDDDDVRDDRRDENGESRTQRQRARDDEDDDDDPPSGDDDDDDELDEPRSRRTTDEDDDDEERDQRRQSRKPGFMNFGSEGDGQDRRGRLKTRNGRIVLTEKDRQTMQKFNMDPDNDKHVEQWARTRREIATDQED